MHSGQSSEASTCGGGAQQQQQRSNAVSSLEKRTSSFFRQATDNVLFRTILNIKPPSKWKPADDRQNITRILSMIDEEDLAIKDFHPSSDHYDEQ